jgi:hypothetical protein
MSDVRPYLRGLRARQARWFDTTVRIVRSSGYADGPSGTVDANTETVYEGAGQVLKAEAVQQAEVIGGAPVERSQYQATVPYDVDVHRRDVLTVVASADVALVGRSFRISDVRRSEWLVHRKLVLEDTRR